MRQIERSGPRHDYGLRTKKRLRKDPALIVARLTPRELALRGGRATGGGSMKIEMDFTSTLEGPT